MPCQLPPQAFTNDVFYLRPLVKFSRDDDSVWFTAVSIGRNKLAMLVKEMCRNSGIAGTKLNISLCATGATWPRPCRRIRISTFCCLC